MSGAKVGKSYPAPAEHFAESRDQSIRNAPHGQQVVVPVSPERGMPTWVAVLIAVGMGLCVIFSAMAWIGSTRSAERAFQSQQSAALAREYAVQVFPQLNRMGYPVKSPGEPEHPVAQPADYAAVDAYIDARRSQ